MNDTRFETLLKTHLDQHVDARLGARRPAPPFEPVSAPRVTGHGPARRWLLPLLAAACVAAVAIASVTLLRSRHDDHTRPAQPTHVVSLGGARIALPEGWVARSYRLYVAKDSFLKPQKQVWCLTPESLPASSAAGACPVRLSKHDPHAWSAFGAGDVDANQQGGATDPPKYCGSQPQYLDEEADVRSFGGRTADWRRWTYTCAPNSRQVEQYVVAFDPAYVLYSSKATPDVHAAMAQIAADSHLPPQSAALRFADFGRVQTVTRVASGVRVHIQRLMPVWVKNQKVLRPDPDTAAADYTVPATSFDRSGAEVGSLVTITTDGSRLLEFVHD